MIVPVNGKIIESEDVVTLYAEAIRALGCFDFQSTAFFIPAELATVKAWAIAEVNRQAGESRSRIGTNIPFQGDMCQMKGEESFSFPSDPDPNVNTYPLAYAEAQARGMPVEAVIAEYCYNAVMWPRILAAIEAVRMGAITAIKSAASINEIEAALVAMEWPV